MESNKVELTIPAKPEFLRIVRLLVSGYGSCLKMSVDEIENMKVAISEACNNSMQNDNGSNGEATISIRCWEESDTLVMEVTDSGIQAFSEGQDEDTEAERGLGFLLIQTLMDAVEVETESGKGSRILMKKKITVL